MNGNFDGILTGAKKGDFSGSGNIHGFSDG